MNALTVAALLNPVVPATAAPTGVVVFPVPPMLAWLIVGGLLAIACALLGLVTESPRPPRPGAPRPRGARPRDWSALQPQPHRS